MHDKISVVTVCYNEVTSIEETIKSVVCQTYPYIEYIIVDGGSSDGTQDIIKKNSQYISYWISEPDHGIFDAMNKGLKKVTGEWVIFMNAGDRFYDKDVIANTFISETSNYTIIYGDTQYIRGAGSHIETAYAPSYIKKNMPTCHQSFFIRSAIAKELRFDTCYQYAADYNMVYKIYKKWGINTIKHINVVISAYEAISGLTMQHENEVFKETLKIRNLSMSVLFGYLKYYIKKISGRK